MSDTNIEQNTKHDKSNDKTKQKYISKKFDITKLPITRHLKHVLYVDMYDESKIYIVESDSKMQIMYEYPCTKTDILCISFNNIDLNSFPIECETKPITENTSIYECFISNFEFKLIIKTISNILKRKGFDIVECEKIMIHSSTSKYLESKVIRLGSVKENNINRNVKTFYQLKRLLDDKRYNRDDESHYNANMIVYFECALDDLLERKITIQPKIKILEIFHNKSRCKTMINTPSKIVVLDGILRL